MFMSILDEVALVIGITAVGVIIWGAFIALIGFFRIEFMRFRGRSATHEFDVLRHEFGRYLLLGLEFMMAADIIHTILSPDLNGLMILGTIVAIRTVLSYFLNKELEKPPQQPKPPESKK